MNPKKNSDKEKEPISAPASKAQETTGLQPSSPKAPFGKKLLFAFLILLFCFFFLEILTRILGGRPMPNTPYADSDYEVGWELKKNFDDDSWLVRDNPDRTKTLIRITTNSYGLRGDEFPIQKPKKEYRILFLGDSVVFGFKLNNSETVPVTLQKYLQQFIANKQINVLNAGVEGYSTSQEYHFVKRRGLNLLPDLILLGFTLDDVFESHLLTETRGGTGGYAGIAGRKSFARTVTSISGHSALFTNVFSPYLKTKKNARLTTYDFLGRRYKSSAQRYNTRSLFAEPLSPEMAKAWKEVENDLLLLKQLCNRHDIPLAVIIFPHPRQVVDTAWSLKPQQRLSDFLGEQEILSFDLAKDFLKQPNAASFFLAKDGDDLSPEGADFTAKLLAGYLKSIVYPLNGNPYAVSRIKFYETASDFEGGRYSRTTWQTRKGVSLQKSGADYPTSGSYTSQPFASPFSISEILPSWNVDRPTSTGFTVYMQVSEDGREWSEWLFLGRDGATPTLRQKELNTTGGFVDVDFLNLTKPYRYFKWRVDLFTQVPSTSPLLRRFAVCYGNSSGDEEVFKKFAEKKTAPRGWARKLDMPYYSQLASEKDIPESMRYSICCPTSVRMVLGYYGIHRSAKEICDLNLDPEYEIWGGWPRSAQTLYQFGFRSYVTQVRSFEEIKSFIARGIPIIISIRAKKGELQSAPYPEVGAHVLVISGLTEDGHVWVEDPYNTDGKMGSRLWTRTEIEKTLIGTGGVVVIAEPPSGN